LSIIVSEALKRQWANMTAVIIAYDLSKFEPQYLA